MKLFKATPEPPSGYDMLIDSLHKTSADLQIVYENLQNVVEPDLIDYYIYQAKAVQMRYKFLLGCVKSEPPAEPVVCSRPIRARFRRLSLKTR